MEKNKKEVTKQVLKTKTYEAGKKVKKEYKETVVDLEGKKTEKPKTSSQKTAPQGTPKKTT